MTFIKRFLFNTKISLRNKILTNLWKQYFACQLVYFCFKIADMFQKISEDQVMYDIEWLWGLIQENKLKINALQYYYYHHFLKELHTKDIKELRTTSQLVKRNIFSYIEPVRM